MTKIFIDGSSGTTGLSIHERLSSYKDIEIIELPAELKKDIQAKKQAINSSDITILCLPDASAKESVSLCENENVVIIDTSTAHRTAEGWVYGFAEIGDNREKLKTAKRIANPGCHASGFISLIAPLVEKGAIDKEEKLTCFSITGYTGGGKNMISEYEVMADESLKAPRLYALGQKHKHLPEMTLITGLKYNPAFCPIVANFPRGMEVVIPLPTSALKASVEKVKEIYKNYYTGSVVKFVENADENGFLTSNKLAEKDSMEISVFGGEDNITLISRFDNLGKGACGSALQNLNIVLGLNEENGLNL